MSVLREAAPLNGQALRPDFIFQSGLDDATFAGVVENFAGDSPSYRQAMAGDEYKSLVLGRFNRKGNAESDS